VPATYIIQKLEQFTMLSTADKQALERAAGSKIRHVASREDIIREGDKPRHVNILLEGFACRYKTLEDGRRQIVSFFIPGDMCDARVFILKQMDHSVGTLAPTKVAEIPADLFIELTDGSPRLTRALWWNSLVEEAIAREWVRNIGQRTAYERLAHLFCEFFIRMRAVGLADDHACELPMTQTELADATGLSTVHVNRTLQDLRGNGLISLRGKTLVIPDLQALQDAALFSPNYLHLDRAGQPYDANDG
jgi:CRP-like cAMP-binding protein